MMKRYLLTISALFLLTSILTAQKVIDGNVVYGNEWIDYDKAYLKIRVAKDGMYKISKAELAEAGFDVNATEMSNYKLMHVGKEVPIKTSTSGIPSDEDYFFFYGEKNRAEVDRFGYEDDNFILNPDYSLVSDTSAYFLTVDERQNKRYEEVYTTSEDLSTPVSPYFLFEEKAVYTQRLYDPTINDENVSYSHLVEGEGYGLIQKNKLNKKLTLTNSYENGPQAIITIRGATNRNNPHYLDIALEGESVFYDTINRNSLFNISHSLDISDVSGDLNVDVVGKANSADLNTLSIISALYPRESSDISDVTSFTINEKAHFVTEESSDEVSYLNIKDGEIVYGLNIGGENHIVLPGSDYSNYHKITDVFEKATLSTGLRTYSKLNTDDFDFLIITNKNLIGESTIVDEYSNFRSSAQGGNYSVRVVDVNELYDQYAYGVDRHFVSIRNYAFDLYERNKNLKNVLILGKAVQYSNNRNPNSEGIQNYVPTFGAPGSDNLLFTMFGEWVSYVPIGRIAATHVDQISNYLNKAKEYLDAYSLPQTIEDKYWMKSLMHLSGGGSKDFGTMRDNLNAMRDTITKEDNMVGAEVISFYKYNEEGVNESFLDKTLELINNGLLIISQFGHGAVNAVDFSIANPDKFDNYKKYHLLMSYGCLTGNCHTNGTGLSEDYVLNQDKGAIGFVATSGYAYPGNLGRFGRNFYDLYGTSHYGKSLGETMNESFSLMKRPNPIYQLGTFLEQWTLHGDPAVELYHFEGADYTFHYSSISTSPEQINAFDKSMKVCVDIYNLGKANTDSLDVKLLHFLEDNSMALDTTLTIASPSGKDNVCFTLPLNSEKYIGKNRVELELNPDRKLVESPQPAGYNNNVLISNTGSTGYEFTIISDNAIATYPYKYGIVNDTKVELIATTYNAFADSASFIMELDTTPYFDSGYKKTHRTISRSPITWQVDVMDKQDQVYYWRVSPDTLVGNASIKPNWDESSFTYIPGDVQGWNQGHWGQFDDDELEGLILKNKNLNYEDLDRTVLMKVGKDIQNTLDIDGVRINKWKKNIKSGIGVLVFDPAYTRPWLNPKGMSLYGSSNGNSNTTYFEYQCSNIEEQDLLLSFLENGIPEGFIVVITTLRDNNNPYPQDFLVDQYESNIGLLNFLKSQGANRVDDFVIGDQLPYVFIYKSGMNEKITEVIGSSSEDNLEVVFPFKSKNDAGFIESTIIGPSKSYEKLNWNLGVPTRDTVSLSLIGIDENGKETSLILNTNEPSIDLSFIDAQIYPYLQIVVNYKKPFIRTPNLEEEPLKNPNLPVYIQVVNEPLIDLILKSSFAPKKSYTAGEKIIIPIEVINIDNDDLNQLYDITYSLNNGNSILEEVSLNFEYLEANNAKRIDLEIDTKKSSNIGSLSVEINKHRNVLENNYSNNIGLLNLDIKQDEISPVLDVTFDGRYIQNEEIVSASPHITITLNDENEYLNIVDQQDLDIKLRFPNGDIRSLEELDIPISVKNDLEQNNLTVDFTPQLKSGIYGLIVKGSDRSGNQTQDFELLFRIIEENMISHVTNFPNPFSTSTQFIFTLTGSAVPPSIIIRIYSLSGKVIREISAEELGPLHIGLNKTTYKWDGTDEFGEKLSNGVYLYKIYTQDDEKNDYQIFDENGGQLDQFMNSGFGKMVIIR